MPHSASITLTLHVGSLSCPLSHSCESYIRLRDDVMVPAGPGVVEYLVDGKVYRWDVVVPPDAGRVIPVSLAAGVEVRRVTDTGERA